MLSPKSSLKNHPTSVSYTALPMAGHDEAQRTRFGRLSAKPGLRYRQSIVTCALAALLCSVVGATLHAQDLRQIAQATVAQQDHAAPGKQVGKSVVFQIPVTMRFLLYLPKDYNGKTPKPLLLFLHGAGERGNDLELVKKHGPPKLIAQGKDFPFIVVSPQCPKGQFWDPRALSHLLDSLEEHYAVDSSRIYVTGLSMGGFGTWALAAQQPDRFAAIAPICGGGERFWMRKLKNVPVWAFHGEKDNVVPPHRTTELVEELKKLGGDVRLTLYPDAGHDSWTETYNNEELYEWFLSHHRAPKEE